MKIFRIALFSVFIFSACNLQVDPETIKKEILEIHDQNIDAHIHNDPDFFTAHVEDSLLSVSHGDFTYRTKKEIRARYEAYLTDTEFLHYKDIEEPLFGCSRDGSVAWLIVRARISGAQNMEADSIRSFDFICAWITLYNKKGGQWIKVAEVDNFREAPDRIQY